MGRYIAFLTFCLVVGCRSNPHRMTNDLHWVYGNPLPFVAPIKQTNFEIDFFTSVDMMIEKFLRDQFLKEDAVSIEPIAMWIVFSYPVKTGLVIESDVNVDITEMSGWFFSPDGVVRETDNINKTQVIVAKQVDAAVSEPTASLTMLLQVKTTDYTNLTTAELSCIWRDGVLQNIRREK